LAHTTVKPAAATTPPVSPPSAPSVLAQATVKPAAATTPPVSPTIGDAAKGGGEVLTTNG